MEKIIECVPNFSEGRDKEIIKKIADCFVGEGVILLGYESDYDHNRSVITAVGEPEQLFMACLASAEVALKNIDLTKHSGVHPRVGAMDVVPFIPIKNTDMNEAIELSIRFGKEIWERYQIPAYLYEHSQIKSWRSNLADIRRGGLESLTQRMKTIDWMPDFGTDSPHKTAGVTVTGARDYLIAYNINLNSENLQIAKNIAAALREKNGGLPKCKALGLYLPEQKCAQVSFNLTNYKITSIKNVYDATVFMADKYGVSIKNSELIGFAPQEALDEYIAEHIKLIDYSPLRILENAIKHKQETLI